MDSKKRWELITRNTEEVITEPELKELLKKKKKPVAYCGYEPNGPLHLGHFVTVTKLMDLEKAGFKVIFFIADVHALLNRKGQEEQIKKEVLAWKKTVKAIGLNAEVILGSSFQFKEQYQKDVMRIAQESTIKRGLKSMQQIARDIEHATISQLWYPIMQVVDIKHLGVDLAYGGMEQRKIHMIGREFRKLTKHNFVVLHTPLITSLKGPGQKMSKSVPNSFISIRDKKEDIVKKIRNAYCPQGDPTISQNSQNNPILAIVKLIIFPMFGEICVKVDKGSGHGVEETLKNYKDLENAFNGKSKDGRAIWADDLKSAVAEYLEKIIAPIRKNFK
ncbi:MAG: tyrosine--tRNA ligase [archaeon]|nr:MAG: tyrosine--tRNA ligase [archaeon]